jgi:hypothetical protein
MEQPFFRSNAGHERREDERSQQHTHREAECQTPSQRADQKSQIARMADDALRIWALFRPRPAAQWVGGGPARALSGDKPPLSCYEWLFTHPVQREPYLRTNTCQDVASCRSLCLCVAANIPPSIG